MRILNISWKEKSNLATQGPHAPWQCLAGAEYSWPWDEELCYPAREITLTPYGIALALQAHVSIVLASYPRSWRGGQSSISPLLISLVQKPACFFLLSLQYFLNASIKSLWSPLLIPPWLFLSYFIAKPDGRLLHTEYMSRNCQARSSP